MAYDESLADDMRAALGAVTGVSEKKMFGGICFLLNGNMLCGVETSRYMFRVGKEREADALARPGAAPMDFTGRPMGGMVWVDAKACEGAELTRWIDAKACEGAELTRWIDFARGFVGALPPK